MAISGLTAESINPFIESTIEAFEAVVGLPTKRTSIEVDRTGRITGELSAIIGITGNRTGTISLSMSHKLAARLLAEMVGAPPETTSSEADIRDAIGELLNIIAGGAKNHLSRQGVSLSISLPVIISGGAHDIHAHRDDPCLAIGFQVAEEPFALRVSLTR
jgi:chemotaxis protein CheX